MKTISVAMQAHLELPTTTLACTVHLTRLDGVEVFATSFDMALTIDGDVYEPFGFMRTDSDSSDNAEIGTTEITGILSSDTITEDDLRVGLWDFAAWEAKYYNWADLTMTPIHQGNGNLGVVRTGRLKFVAEMLPVMQAMQQAIGNLNSPLCIHNFGESDGGVNGNLGNGCTVDVTPFTFTGTISSVDSDFYGVHVPQAQADGYFSNGKFRITSGARSGSQFEVRAYLVGFLILFTALPEDLAGETYEIVRGCNKSLRQCVDDFDNILDRLASDYTQGSDAAIASARHNG